MKLTQREVTALKERMNIILKDPVSTPLEIKLATYWLDRINRRGKYCIDSQH